MKKILITGSAGFIGYHLTSRLIQEKYDIIGIDDINNYYDVNLKYGRLEQLGIKRNKIKKSTSILSEIVSNFLFIKINLKNKKEINRLFEKYNFDYVINLAAQVGVRYSLKNPYKYTDSNINGFLNILEECCKHHIKHLIYASSSSVYGLNEMIPFSVHTNVDHPISLYAATKKSNELMAHVYSYIYKLPVTGLRFFTVYGPWGRPDMAYFKFTDAIYKNKPIEIYNNGNMKRDFTYVSDIVEAIIKLINKIPSVNKNWNADDPDPSSSSAPYKLYNIGNNKSVELLYFIEILEELIGKKAIKKFLPIQAGEVIKTHADIDDLARDIGFTPSTSIDKGLSLFLDWYKSYYAEK